MVKMLPLRRSDQGVFLVDISQFGIAFSFKTQHVNSGIICYYINHWEIVLKQKENYRDFPLFAAPLSL